MSQDIEFKGLRFLLIDDMMNMRKTIRNMLHLLGVQKTYEADSGKTALSKLRETSIDFIICDWNMPGISGIEFSWQNCPIKLNFLLNFRAFSSGRQIQNNE